MTVTRESGPAGGPAPSLLAALAAMLFLAGCGGGEERSAATTLPGCAAVGTPIARPAALPQTFPLPAGTVLDRARREAGFEIVEGFGPGPLESTRDFFLAELPKAGFELGEADAEDTEAETEFTHEGTEGRLKLRELAGCDGALTLGIAVKPEQD